MGDSSTNDTKQGLEAKLVEKNTKPSLSNESGNTLKTTKPSRNIHEDASNDQKVDKNQTITPVVCTAVETVYTNAMELQQSTVEVETPRKLDPGSPRSLTSPRGLAASVGLGKTRASSAYGSLEKDKCSRNQSNILWLPEPNNNTLPSLFSVGGAPSRRVFRNQAACSKIFVEPPSDDKTPEVEPEKNKEFREGVYDLRRPSSAFRNPLTGTGMTSNDEYKFKASRRKDGNPLLGLGYDRKEVTTPPANSNQRIPPGGYCHKLW